MCDCGDPPTLFESVTIKARTKHACGECGREINRGELYRRESGLWDGQWDHHKFCTDCTAVMEREFKADPCFCFIYGELHEAVEQAVAERGAA